MNLIKVVAIQPGFDFKYWIENGILQGSPAEFFLTATKDKKFTAYFAKSVASILSNEIKFNLAPNPATDKVYVEVPTHLRSYTVSIISIDGKFVKEYLNPAILQVESLPRGLYFIELKSEGVTKVEKLELR